MTRLLWICVAGGLGSGARYLVTLWAGRTFGTAFPYGTLAVNVAGCFLIALIMTLALTTTLVPPNLRFALTTGFLGGLTTYSTFNYETTEFVPERAWRSAALNASLTVLCCFVAGLLGLALARRIAT